MVSGCCLTGTVMLSVHSIALDRPARLHLPSLLLSHTLPPLEQHPPLQMAPTNDDEWHFYATIPVGAIPSRLFTDILLVESLFHAI